VGANDVIYFSSLTKSAETVDLLLPAISSRVSQVVFLTSGDIGKAPLWPFPLNMLYTARMKSWRDTIAPILARHSVVFVDLLSLPDPFLSDVTRYYAADGLHLSGDGYGVWADHILHALHEKDRAN
jgi:lysophospholipase L1-like esterase